MRNQKLRIEMMDRGGTGDGDEGVIRGRREGESDRREDKGRRR